MNTFGEIIERIKKKNKKDENKMEKTTLSKNEQIQLIKTTWQKIAEVLSCQSSVKYAKQYLSLNIQEEKNHDKFRPINTIRGLTILEAGKFFAVKQIIEFLTDKKYIPSAKDYLFVRQSIFFAYALVSQYRKEFEIVLKDVCFDDILNMDYTELMK